MRTLAIALLSLLTAASALAQTPEPGRAAQALGANWRPIDPAGLGSPEALQSACAGAIEEIAAVEAMLPATLDAPSLARVRSRHGLVIVASDRADAVYLFAPAAMRWLGSGLATLAVLDEAQGRLALRDAGGTSFSVQIGRVGGRAVLRAQPPDGGSITLAGCAPTATGTEPSTQP